MKIAKTPHMLRGATKQIYHLLLACFVLSVSWAFIFLSIPYPSLLVWIKEMMITEITTFLLSPSTDILSIFTAICIYSKQKWANERELYAKKGLKAMG